MRSTLADELPTLLAELAQPNLRFADRYPGEPAARQPIHTVYGGAQLFRADLAARLGTQAMASLTEYGGDPFTFAEAIGLGIERPEKKRGQRELLALFERDPERARAEHPQAWLAHAIHQRVQEKLVREPVEDFRIDFEDGFGVRPDAEEDEHAIRCADEVARGAQDGTLPPFLGIRIKALNEEMKRRALRTLDLFLTRLVDATSGQLPPWFAITLPKVPIPEHVAVLARALTRIEQKLGLPDRALKIELMIELTQSIFDRRGQFNLPLLLDAAEGRCAGAHFGTYDYTASCQITAAHQTMEHPACQLALHLMKIAYANTGIFLSDGATNVLPVPIHRGEGALGKKQRRENERAVHGAWALSYRHIERSLQNGFYQGWDLHPAQLPVRYAANYAFFLQGFDAAAARLANFVQKAAQATLVGDVFDDAATGQGLLNYFLRAQGCGAIESRDLEATGLTVDELQTRSFAKILALRTQRLGTS